MPQKPAIASLVQFFSDAGKLKEAKRFGSSLSIHESSADHSWRLTFMALLLVHEFKLAINLEKALQIAIIHDLAESVTGDIDALDQIEHPERMVNKKADEEKVITEFATKYPVGPLILTLWQEYKEQQTPEARFIKALDKIEGFLQVKEAGYTKYTHQIFHANYADDAVANFPALAELLAFVKSELKEELSKGNIIWRENNE